MPFDSSAKGKLLYKLESEDSMHLVWFDSCCARPLRFATARIRCLQLQGAGTMRSVIRVLVGFPAPRKFLLDNPAADVSDPAPQPPRTAPTGLDLRSAHSYTCDSEFPLATEQSTPRLQADAQRADERRRSAQHGGVRSIGWLGLGRSAFNAL